MECGFCGRTLKETKESYLCECTIEIWKDDLQKGIISEEALNNNFVETVFNYYTEYCAEENFELLQYLEYAIRQMDKNQSEYWLKKLKQTAEQQNRCPECYYELDLLVIHDYDGIIEVAYCDNCKEGYEDYGNLYKLRKWGTIYHKNRIR